MKMAGGATEDDIVIGNAFDKYGSRNPIVRWMMKGFDDALASLMARTDAKAIHEIGCGEGFWTIQWLKQGLDVRGCDFSGKVVEIAQQNAALNQVPPERFSVKSIYDLKAPADGADLVVCCEVLEHLESPQQGIAALQSIATGYVILSVPREPLWCLLNFARGKYLRQWGNTPGHIQHWSKRQFVAFVSQYFDVVEVRSPLPWTMVLCKARTR